MDKQEFFASGYLYNPKTNSVLLHLRDGKTAINPHKWAFFGGLSEPGETPKQCFLRELKEELNISFPEEEVKELRHYWNSERSVERYVFYVESELKKSDMMLGEGAGFEWVSFEKVFDYDLTDKTRDDLLVFHQLAKHKQSANGSKK